MKKKVHEAVVSFFFFACNTPIVFGVSVCISTVNASMRARIKNWGMSRHDGILRRDEMANRMVGGRHFGLSGLGREKVD